MKVSSTCVRTLQFSSSSITTNSGYTPRWATVLRRSLKDKPSAKVRQIRKERRSPLSLAWLNLLQGCWSIALQQCLPLLHRLQTILNNQCCRTMILQRTATTPLTPCLSSRVHSTRLFQNCYLSSWLRDEKMPSVSEGIFLWAFCREKGAHNGHHFRSRWKS